MSHSRSLFFRSCLWSIVNFTSFEIDQPWPESYVSSLRYNVLLKNVFRWSIFYWSWKVSRFLIWICAFFGRIQKHRNWDFLSYKCFRYTSKCQQLFDLQCFLMHFFCWSWKISIFLRWICAYFNKIKDLLNAKKLSFSLIKLF